MVYRIGYLLILFDDKSNVDNMSTRIIANERTYGGRNGVRIEKEVRCDGLGEHAVYSIVPERYILGGLIRRDLEKHGLHSDGHNSSFVDVTIKSLYNGGIVVCYTTIEDSTLKHNKKIVLFN